MQAVVLESCRTVQILPSRSTSGLLVLDKYLSGPSSCLRSFFRLTQSAVGAIVPEDRTFGAEKFDGDVASKSGCEGYPAVGHRNVDAMVIGDRSDEGVAVKG